MRTMVMMVSLAACGTAGSGETLEMPVLGVTELSTWGPGEVVSGSDGAVIESENHLTFGMGEGYPTEMRVDLLRFSVGGCSIDELTWTADQVQSSDEGVVRAEVDGDLMRLRTVGAGLASVVLTGTFEDAQGCLGEGPAELPARLTYEVEVVQDPAGRLYGSCVEEGSFDVVAGASTDGIGVMAVDALGEQIVLNNAERFRQVPVTLFLDGPSATPPEGTLDDFALFQLAFAGEGEVAVEISGQDAGRIGVVPPSDIDAIDLMFMLVYATGTSHVELEDGRTYNWSDVVGGRQIVPYVGRPMIEGGAVCSIPQRDWFEVGSVPELPTQDFYTRELGYPMNAGVALEFGTGALELTLEAPELAGGKGIEHTVHVTFIEE